MGFFSRLFTFRGTVYGLRKKYDRVRERADREDNPEKRLDALRILDQANNTLMILEEQNVSRFDRGRMVAAINSGIEQAKAILDDRIRRREQQMMMQQTYSGQGQMGQRQPVYR